MNQIDTYCELSSFSQHNPIRYLPAPYLVWSCREGKSVVCSLPDVINVLLPTQNHNPPWYRCYFKWSIGILQIGRRAMKEYGRDPTHLIISFLKQLSSFPIPLNRSDIWSENTRIADCREGIQLDGDQTFGTSEDICSNAPATFWPLYTSNRRERWGANLHNA